MRKSLLFVAATLLMVSSAQAADKWVCTFPGQPTVTIRPLKPCHYTEMCDWSSWMQFGDEPRIDMEDEGPVGTGIPGYGYSVNRNGKKFVVALGTNDVARMNVWPTTQGRKSGLKAKEVFGTCH